MSNLVQTYRLHDLKDQQTEGAVRINRNDAKHWNDLGYGIFHTANYFHRRRIKANLAGINAWFVEIDGGNKSEMMALIKLGLIPTMIVESKNGYHVYWKSKDGTPENWSHIVARRLIPFYNGDKKAKDITRILRSPGFNHMKNPNDPFPVKIIAQHKVEYSERDMFSFYKDLVQAKESKARHRKSVKQNPMDGEFWNNVWNLNCEYALEKLSGTQHVGGEVFSFINNSSGTKNIYVNGKSTSCWIDLDGRIGSFDEGGPTIAQYLDWYHKNMAKTVSIIKEVFPECQSNQSQMTLI